MYEAFEYIKKALVKDDQIFAVHKVHFAGDYEIPWITFVLLQCILKVFTETIQLKHL